MASTRHACVLTTLSAFLLAGWLTAACGGGGSSSFPGPNPPPGTSARVTVDAGRIEGPVSKLLWGTQITWTGPGNGLGPKVTTPEQADAAWKKFMSYEPLVAQMGPTVIRYPAGLLANHYDWRQGIGPMWERPIIEGTKNRNAIIGSDEFLRFAEALGSEAMITINWALGPAVAADWVEYCNSPNDGANPRSGTDWAAERAKNGHPEPYHVRFWEIGNELRGEDVFMQIYGASLKVFATEMHKADPSIEIGAIGYGPYFEPEFAKKWDRIVDDAGGNGFSWWSRHYYAPGAFAPNQGFEISKKGVGVEDTEDFPRSDTYTFKLNVYNVQRDTPPHLRVTLDGKLIQEFDVTQDGPMSFTSPVDAGPHKFRIELASNGIVRLYHEVPATAPRGASVTLDLKNSQNLYEAIQAGFLSQEQVLLEPRDTLGGRPIFATENNTIYDFEVTSVRHTDLREALGLADMFNVFVRNGLPVSTTFMLYEEDAGLGEVEGVAYDQKSGEYGRDDPRPRPTFYVQKLYRDYLTEGDRVNIQIDGPTYETGQAAGLSMGMVSTLVTEVGYVQGVAGLSPNRDRLTIMLLNKSKDRDQPIEVELDNFTPQSTAEMATVTGPSIDSNNEPESGPPSVGITTRTLTEVSTSFPVTLPRHSVSAIVFRPQ